MSPAEIPWVRAPRRGSCTGGGASEGGATAPPLDLQAVISDVCPTDDGVVEGHRQEG